MIIIILLFANYLREKQDYYLQPPVGAQQPGVVGSQTRQIGTPVTLQVVAGQIDLHVVCELPPTK